MNPSEPRLGADARKIALLEKLRNRALRGTGLLREAIAGLTDAEMGLLHDHEIKQFYADAVRADGWMEAAAP